jgi:predicted O-methyltransferase YrrM
MTSDKGPVAAPTASFPKSIRQRVLAQLARIRGAWRELRFHMLPRVAVDAGALGICDASRLDALLDPGAVSAEWAEDQQVIRSLGLPEMTGGVNPGDQRALHALALGFRPTRILEVGTHLGCSTVPLALVARRTGAELVTCDVVDVNDEISRPWLRYGSTRSPRSLVADVGCSAHVQFSTLDSLDFLRKVRHEFDLIFLDGDHAAATVYRELPLALRALRPGGYVLLHDYYPENRPLWLDEPPIRGPFLAVKRLQAEGAQFDVMGLGVLRWPTRSGSCITSLALMSRSR